MNGAARGRLANGVHAGLGNTGGAGVDDVAPSGHRDEMAMVYTRDENGRMVVHHRKRSLRLKKKPKSTLNGTFYKGHQRESDVESSMGDDVQSNLAQPNVAQPDFVRRDGVQRDGDQRDGDQQDGVQLDGVQQDGVQQNDSQGEAGVGDVSESQPDQSTIASDLSHYYVVDEASESQDDGPRSSTPIPNIEVREHGSCLTQDDLPSQIVPCSGENEATPSNLPSDGETEKIPCGQDDNQPEDLSQGPSLSDTQMAVVGEQIEAATKMPDIPVPEVNDEPPTTPTHPDYIPEPLFEGHNVANDRIGVFTGKYINFFQPYNFA